MNGVAEKSPTTECREPPAKSSTIAGNLLPIMGNAVKYRLLPDNP
jgi:hypothetical protein